MDKSKTRTRVPLPLTQPAPKLSRVIVLPSGREIPEVLAFAFRDQVLRRSPQLVRGRVYKLKQICGNEFWALYSTDQVRLGGQYIAVRVSRGELPLEFAVCPHAVPKRYRLK